MIKKSIFLIILIVFLTMVYADGNAKDVPMEDIENKLIEETDLGKMAKCGNRNLMQFLNLDYQQYDEYLYYKGKEALSVDEVLIVKAKKQRRSLCGKRRCGKPDRFSDHHIRGIWPFSGSSAEKRRCYNKREVSVLLHGQIGREKGGGVRQCYLAALFFSSIFFLS